MTSRVVCYGGRPAKRACTSAQPGSAALEVFGVPDAEATADFVHSLSSKRHSRALASASVNLQDVADDLCSVVAEPSDPDPADQFDPAFPELTRPAVGTHAQKYKRAAARRTTAILRRSNAQMLLIEARKGDVDAVQRRLAKGTKIDFTDEDGNVNRLRVSCLAHVVVWQFPVVCANRSVVRAFPGSRSDTTRGTHGSRRSRSRWAFGIRWPASR